MQDKSPMQDLLSNAELAQPVESDPSFFMRCMNEGLGQTGQTILNGSITSMLGIGALAAAAIAVASFGGVAAAVPVAKLAVDATYCSMAVGAATAWSGAAVGLARKGVAQIRQLCQ